VLTSFLDFAILGLFKETTDAYLPGMPEETGEAGSG
jgi:hypothetical protein